MKTLVRYYGEEGYIDGYFYETTNNFVYAIFVSGKGISYINIEHVEVIGYIQNDGSEIYYKDK